MSILRDLVSSNDLVTAVAAPTPQARHAQCLISFTAAGLFAISLESVLAELEQRPPADLPKTLVLYAPAQMSYGIARMLQSGAGLGKLTSVFVEREEKIAIALAGLRNGSLNAALAQSTKLPATETQTPAPLRAGRASFGSGSIS